MNGRSKLRRWHIWLAWVAAIPMLLWVVSGLVMVARPIEEVRGEALLKPANPIRLVGPPIAPLLQGVALTSLSLEQRAAGPRWIVKLKDGTTRLADPETGLLLPALSAADAAREVEVRYAGSASVRSVQEDRRPKTTARSEAPHLGLAGNHGRWRPNSTSMGRREQVCAYADPLVAILRPDVGHHIMDLKTREDAHNPLVIGLGLIALAVSVIGVILLPTTLKRKARSLNS